MEMKRFKSEDTSNDDFENRKSDHIELAFQSQQNRNLIDSRFYYEPILEGHVQDESTLECSFAGFNLKLPLWVSSMTGGTEKAGVINHRLAKVCGEYGMGMGLGSCRILLENEKYFDDFDVKELLGDYPLFANVGIAQMEEIAVNSRWYLIKDLIKNLHADGLIIHVNPWQEWYQPEGDRFSKPPLDTIKHALDALDIPIVVKEVGQGMGPESLAALCELPIAGIEFGASGGTNFALLELLRSDDFRQSELEMMTHIGHTAMEMVQFMNDNKKAKKDIIISGGVKNILDGYYLQSISKNNAIIGQASKYLKYAIQGTDELRRYVDLQKESLLLANSYLKPKL